ncbi:MAG: exodeoxyribonuclease VII small subunit [Micrococcales bacterium]|nr:exodeoxyribonuclease VII small subunit [Micrococcales bacterium]
MQTAPETPPAEVAGLGYEQARDELVRVVTALEQGSPTLEESLALWERGEALARRCEEWLIGAKARLDAARSGASEQPGAARSGASEQPGAARSGASEPGGAARSGAPDPAAER